jgi:hypothetical protein
MNKMKRNLFAVDDGGDIWIYSSLNEDEAIGQHIKLNYIDAGVRILEDIEVKKIPLTRLVAIDGVKKLAKIWSSKNKGLLGCTIT